MAETNPYTTPRALAEDILEMAVGGGMRSDDQNLGMRQVLYWISTFAAERYAVLVEQAGGIASAIDYRLWSPLRLAINEAPQTSGPLNNYPKTLVVADLPAGILSSGGKLMLNNLFWGTYQLTELPLDVVRQGSIAWGRFGKEQYGWAVEGKRLYANLPLTAEGVGFLRGQAVVLPEASGMIDNPDIQIPWLSEWTAGLRQQCLTLLQPTLSQAPDQINNGADQQADKR
ncbi:hypothetical protein CLV58_12555 [Spirosoma oryzae]|uniref:Uncharacterized protein n=1 Tax=Spirosoma oryzae TaxID=1469603 RepID=A0A2T0S900_9BACT|nr:hypothetical protein [Spirosoma oryzae]PRY29793.1 hypothetical protein CLV58_12555 [Spirosoma oryzae]